MEANKKLNKTKTFKSFNINLHETNTAGDTPLHIAVHKGNLSKVKNLISYLINIDPNLINRKNNYGNTPLQVATWSGQLGIVDYLVEQGADLKTKDNYGQTLLHAAAWNGYLYLVEFFLKKDLSLEDKDQNGNTPLLSAAKNGHLKVVKSLLFVGSDIAAQDNQGDSVLTIAAKNGDLKLIDYFAYEKKIDLSTIRDKNNNTLLHLAVENGHIKLVKYLFYFRNLDLEAKNNDGNTPLDIAMEIEDKNLIENLLQLGAKIDPAKLEGNVRVHQVTQDKPQALGLYILKENKDLLTNVTLPEVNSRLEVNPRPKKIKGLKNKRRDLSKPETWVKDAFDMQGLNDSLSSWQNTTASFFQSHA